MTYWPAFLSLSAAGLIGVVVFAATAPRDLLDKIPIENELRKRLLIAIQPSVILLLLTAGGTAAADTIGAQSLIAEAASGAGLPDGWLGPIAIFALVGSVAGAGLYLLDRWVKPWWAGPDDTDLIDNWKPGAIIPGVFYGGITEEVMMRWGVMSLVLAGLAALFGDASDPKTLAVALAILLSALIFAAGHLPAAMLGAKRSGRLVARIIGLNAIAGLLFGWVFWRWNLETAMAAHAGFHVGAAILVLSMRKGRPKAPQT